MTHYPELPTFALEWCRKLGANPDSLEPLRGGINSQVFRCSVRGRKIIIKGYAAQNAREHDRFKAEVEFLNYAQLVAPEFVPMLLDSAEENRSLILESIHGEGFTEGTHPSEEDIDHAINFMRRLNIDVNLAGRHVKSSASEGFLKVTEHLQNIKQRLDNMTTEHLSVQFRAEARELIEGVRRQLLYLQESTEQLLAKSRCENALEPGLRCVSPSDFGFHNAIRTPQGIRFFDFEFAGWDDPAKAVADFDLQPRIRLKSRLGALGKALPKWNKDLAARYEILFPILKLKWVCIILVFMNPTRWGQIITLDKNQASALSLQTKLNLAKMYLLKD